MYFRKHIDRGHAKQSILNSLFILLCCFSLMIVALANKMTAPNIELPKTSEKLIQIPSSKEIAHISIGINPNRKYGIGYNDPGYWVQFNGAYTKVEDIPAALYSYFNHLEPLKSEKPLVVLSIDHRAPMEIVNEVIKTIQYADHLELFILMKTV